MEITVERIYVKIVYKSGKENTAADYLSCLNSVSIMNENEYSILKNLPDKEYTVKNNKIILKTPEEEQEFLKLSHSFYIHPIQKSSTKLLRTTSPSKI